MNERGSLQCVVPRFAAEEGCGDLLEMWIGQIYEAVERLAVAVTPPLQQNGHISWLARLWHENEVDFIMEMPYWGRRAGGKAVRVIP